MTLGSARVAGPRPSKASEASTLMWAEILAGSIRPAADAEPDRAITTAAAAASREPDFIPSLWMR